MEQGATRDSCKDSFNHTHGSWLSGLGTLGSAHAALPASWSASNARAAVVAAQDLPCILSAMLQPDYLTRLSNWPPQYGGGAQIHRWVSAQEGLFLCALSLATGEGPLHPHCIESRPWLQASRRAVFGGHGPVASARGARVKCPQRRQRQHQHRVDKTVRAACCLLRGAACEGLLRRSAQKACDKPARCS